MAFNATNPVVVGAATKKDHYDRAFDNTKFLYSNHLLQSFRGLQFRTHPDADKAKSQVMLVHAEEIVFDDGTRITAGLDRLVADITVAGAGGLDTGAEAAGHWYEAYCIRKSSDGTLNLLLHDSLSYSPDTSFTTAPDLGIGLRLATGTTTDKLAQGVKFANSKPCVFLDVKLQRAGAVSGNIWFTLESDSAGSPSGTVLATSDKIDASVIATAIQPIRIAFRNPYTVTASTQYHLVLQGDYTRSDTVFIGWQGLVAGGYANGSAKQYNGAAWSAAGVGDFYFSADVEISNVAVTMPTGYDQKCKVGQVINDSGSDFREFIAYDRDVRFKITQVIVTAGAPTIAALIDLASFVPPGPVVWTAAELSESNTGANLRLGSHFDLTNTWFGQYWDWPAAAYFLDFAISIPIEYQHAYYMVSAGTTNIYIQGYRWVR